jgi:hypothetical protein
MGRPWRLRCVWPLVTTLHALVQTGCKETINYAPVSVTEVRHAVDDVRAGRTVAPLRDISGKIHQAGPSTPLKASGPFAESSYRNYDVDGDGAAVVALRDLVSNCQIHNDCALGEPHTQWQVGERKRVPDGVALLVAGLGTALVAGNVVCFGTDACPGSAKVLVGVADGLLGVAAIVAIVATFALVFRSPGD